MDIGAIIPEWSGRRAREALAAVKARGAAGSEPCVLCGQSINYRLVYPHPMSCSVQHLKSRRDYPQLTWDPTNWAPAHLKCNLQHGSGEPLRTGVPPVLGVVSQEW